MKNYEAYIDEIREYKGSDFCGDFIIPYILKSEGCCSDVRSCDVCRMLQMIWLMEEYEEPETDWSKVEVDTQILVRNRENEKWLKRHFAEYEDGKVYAWYGGFTRWTVSNNGSMTAWKYAKLAESEESDGN